MKRTHVTIDGITLTAEQVERAQKALTVPTFVPGDRVAMDSGLTGIVLGLRGDDSQISKAVENIWPRGSQPGQYHVLGISPDIAGNVYSYYPEHLTRQLSL
jgi:hypothetical protein